MNSATKVRGLGCRRVDRASGLRFVEPSGFLLGLSFVEELGGASVGLEMPGLIGFRV